MSIERSVTAIDVVSLEMDTPVVVDVDTPLSEVIQQMRDGSYGCALVCRDGKLDGVFTERDVLNKVVGIDGIADHPISEFMTPHPVSVPENAPVRNAIRVMVREGFRNMPIVDPEGGVISCVRHKDLVRFLVEHFAQQVLNLPPDPENMPDEPNGG
jgi:CBS domain-containing protein